MTDVQHEMKVILKKKQLTIIINDRINVINAELKVLRKEINFISYENKAE